MYCHMMIAKTENRMKRVKVYAQRRQVKSSLAVAVAVAVAVGMRGPDTPPLLELLPPGFLKGALAHGPWLVLRLVGGRFDVMFLVAQG